ncbi:MAG: hypothetical protein B6226_02465 [Candidatus Cloacimonetes bacterium 4572_65]|nr:MAG: hypothetical protein B6226_02465 [Candidatus Cloacimonetes bacterium 4572_65]
MKEKIIKDYLSELDSIDEYIANYAKKKKEVKQLLINKLTTNSSIKLAEPVTEHLKNADTIVKIGYWVHDLTNDLFMGTRECYNLFGIKDDMSSITREQFIGLIHPDDVEALMREYQAATEKGEPFGSAYRLVRADGTIRFVISHSIPKFDDNGELNICHGAIFDLPFSDQDQFVLQTISNNKILGKDTAVGFWEHDLTNENEYWSKSLYNLIESSPNELNPTFDNFISLIHSDDKEEYVKLLQKYSNSESNYTHTFKILTAKNNIKVIHSQVNNVTNSQGVIVKKVGLVFDVSKIYACEVNSTDLSYSLDNLLPNISGSFIVGHYDGKLNFTYIDSNLKELLQLDDEATTITIDKLFNTVDYLDKYSTIKENQNAFKGSYSLKSSFKIVDQGTSIHISESLRFFKQRVMGKQSFIMHFKLLRQKSSSPAQLENNAHTGEIITALNYKITQLDELNDLNLSFENTEMPYSGINKQIKEKTDQIKELLNKLSRYQITQ